MKVSVLSIERFNADQIADAMLSCRHVDDCPLLVFTVFFPQSVTLFVVGLVASATSAYAVVGFCFTTRECSSIGTKVENFGAVPPNCNSFLAIGHTNLHEDDKCLMAGYSIYGSSCGAIPLRRGKPTAIKCVSKLS